MRPFLATATLLVLASAAGAQEVPKDGPSQEIDSCRRAALVALKARTPPVSDVLLDPDASTIAKADLKVEDTPVKTVVMGDAYLERKGTDKPHRYLCLIGEKGKVLLTFFTEQ